MTTVTALLFSTTANNAASPPPSDVIVGGAFPVSPKSATLTVLPSPNWISSTFVISMTSPLPDKSAAMKFPVVPLNW